MPYSAKLLFTVAATAGCSGFVLGKAGSSRESVFKTVNAASPPPDLVPSPPSSPFLATPTSPSAKPFPWHTPTPSEQQSTLTVGPHRVSEIMRFGFPTADYIRSRKDYVLAYDRKNRTALWVAEHLTYDRIKDKSRVSRKNSEFMDDQSVHPYFRSTNEDYRSSGFDRGHLAAAGNHSIDQESLNETFLLSNISPQVGVGFNRDAWNKLEQYVRFKTKSCANLYVITGPLYLSALLEDGKHYIKYQVLGSNHVAVPTHFFKAILCETSNKEFHLECYVMPNKAIEDSIPIQAFQVPPDSIERSAGFLLFEGLPRSSIKTINGKPSFS